MAHPLWQNIPVEVVDQAVSQTMLMLIESDASPVAKGSIDGANDISMAVYCDEGQQSAVLVRCSPELASMLTSRMFESPEDKLQDEDIQDATGELVNVIAGSLRGLMNSPGAMSTPFRVHAEDLQSFQLLDERHYYVEQHSLWVVRL